MQLDDLTQSTQKQAAFDRLRNKPAETRRRYKRHLFFQLARLASDTGSPELIVFTRDISRVGMGLIHNQPLPVQRARMHLDHMNIEITVDIGLCQPCGGGWFRSYAHFVDVAAIAATKLCVSTIMRMADPRSMLRHPFFGPVQIAPVANRHENISVFTRDISMTGVGLFHDSPLENRGIWLDIPGNPRHLWAKIRWCKPCGHGWYISGAQFDKESANELSRHV